MIEDRNLKPGTKLVAKYKGREHRAKVVVGEEGRVRYRLPDGREFASPSGAASAVMGGLACNGWRFWSVARAKDAKPTKASKRVKTPGRTKSKGGTRTNVRVHRNGRGREGGGGGAR
jgi:hypothetical protein